MAAFALFSNSDTSQMMPEMALGSCLHCSRCILVKCQKSGPWAIAQQLGQLPLWIYKPIWAATYILCIILAATGVLPNKKHVRRSQCHPTHIRQELDTRNNWSRNISGPQSGPRSGLVAGLGNFLAKSRFLLSHDSFLYEYY